MTRRDVRDVVRAVVIGSVTASVVATVSLLLGTPRVWPGTVLSFITSTGMWWLLISQRDKGCNR